MCDRILGQCKVLDENLNTDLIFKLNISVVAVVILVKPEQTQDSWTNIGYILDQHLRRWPNNKSTLLHHLVLAGTPGYIGFL